MTAQQIADAIAAVLEDFTQKRGKITFLSDTETRADLQARLVAALAAAATP